VAAVGFAARSTTKVIGGGEDHVGAFHVEVLGLEAFGGFVGMRWLRRNKLRVAHEKRPG
jgi:hypothetical protein